MANSSLVRAVGTAAEISCYIIPLLHDLQPCSSFNYGFSLAFCGHYSQLTRAVSGKCIRIAIGSDSRLNRGFVLPGPIKQRFKKGVWLALLPKKDKSAILRPPSARKRLSIHEADLASRV